MDGSTDLKVRINSPTTVKAAVAMSARWGESRLRRDPSCDLICSECKQYRIQSAFLFSFTFHAHRHMLESNLDL